MLKLKKKDFKMDGLDNCVYSIRTYLNSCERNHQLLRGQKMKKTFLEIIRFVALPI